MKTLSQSKIFDVFKSEKLSGVGVLQNIDEKLDKVNPTAVEEALRIINKRENLPLKTKTLDNYHNDRVVLLHNESRLASLPQFLPIWAKMEGGIVKSYVNLTSYGRYTKNNELDIANRQLLGLMMGGTIIREAAAHPDQVFSGMGLLRPLTTIYSRIFTKVIDKLYGIGMDPVVSDKIRYLTGRFFLQGLLEKPVTDSMRDIAMSCILKVSPAVVASVESEITDADFEDLEVFCKAIARLFEKTSNFNIRTLYGEISKTYRSPALMMMEYPPYLVVNIVFTLLTSNINNEFAFEAVLGKNATDGAKVYAEISRIIN